VTHARAAVVNGVAGRLQFVPQDYAVASLRRVSRLAEMPGLRLSWMRRGLLRDALSIILLQPGFRIADTAHVAWATAENNARTPNRN